MLLLLKNVTQFVNVSYLSILIYFLFNEISNLQAEEVIQNVSSKLLEKCSLAGSFEVGILRKALAGT